MKLIDKSALVAEIERLISNGQTKLKESEERKDYESYVALAERIATCINVLSFLDTLEVKKLPNPRFPHLNNIVDKVFGAGNLESWEYEEAEQLVLLAKEELLKDLKVKEVDLNKEISQFIDANFEKATIGHKLSLRRVAKHFYELGLKAIQKEEK